MADRKAVQIIKIGYVLGVMNARQIKRDRENIINDKEKKK